MNMEMRRFSQLSEGEKFTFLGVELEKVGSQLARDEHGRPWYMDPCDMVLPLPEPELQD
jgi:hypothetical protein